jgi:hypothetical protein
MASTETKLRKNTVQSLSLTYAEMSKEGCERERKGEAHLSALARYFHGSSFTQLRRESSVSAYHRFIM